VGEPKKPPKRQYGYSRQDHGILTSPRAVEKIHKRWSNTKQTFDFYFLRSAQAYKHVEVGEVNETWIRENLGVDIHPEEDAITVVFTNNRGAEAVPMTAWTIAHRLGHAIRQLDEYQEVLGRQLERDLSDLLQYTYNVNPKQNMGGYYGYQRLNESALKALAHALGTMRSARQGNMRNFYEFAHEIFAQYLMTGRVTFNPLPRTLILQMRYAWGRPAPKTAWTKLDEDAFNQVNEEVAYLADKYTDQIEQLLESLVGRVFVM
jgi:hypothetical protein